MLSSAVSSVFPPPLHAASLSLASSRCAPSKSGRNGCRNSRSRRSSSGVPLIIRSCTLPGGSSPPPAPAASMERREMLAASVLTASTFLFPHSAFGAPVQPPPDVSSCVAPTSRGNPLPFLTELDYCMGIGGKNITATPFVFPAERKLRKAAHKMSASEVADYNEAYRRMRALSDEDPRSLRRQAAIHAAFCNFVYKGTQGESTFLNMHGSDLFLPWHSVADCLTASSKLNISYQPATKGDANWINYKPQASRRNLQKSKDQKRKSGKALSGPQILTNTICALVTPPTADKNVSKQPILVLENVKLFLSSPVSFAIFIDFPDADSTTGLDCAEFVGLYTNIPHVGMEDMEGPSKLRLKFPLRDCVQILNLDSNAPFIVNVVSRSNPDPIKYPVSIGGFRIIYE